MNPITNFIAPRITTPLKALTVEAVLLFAIGVGVAATPLALVMPSNVDIRKFADLTECSKSLLPGLFKGVVSVINPDMKTERYDLDGILTCRLQDMSRNALRNASERGKPCRGLTVRLIIAGTLVAKVATRVLDLALGVIGAAAVLVTFGRLQKVNAFAMRQLSVFGLIDDVCKGLRELVRPSILQHERTF